MNKILNPSSKYKDFAVFLTFVLFIRFKQFYIVHLKYNFFLKYWDDYIEFYSLMILMIIFNLDELSILFEAKYFIELETYVIISFI